AAAGARKRAREPRWSRRLWAVLVLLAAAILGATGVYVESADRALVASTGEGLALAAADVARNLARRDVARGTEETIERATDTVQLLRRTPARLGWGLVGRDGRVLAGGGTIALDTLVPPSPVFVSPGHPGWIEGETENRRGVVVGWAPIPGVGAPRRA